MFESFLVALRVVIPMALLMGVGAGIRMAGIIDRTTMRSVDKMTFRVFMPTLLFKNIYETSFSNMDGGELLFSVVGLVLVFLLALLLPPRLIKDHNQAASVGQAIIRSNYILFGVAVAESIYGAGNAGPVALLGAIVVPATNALSVVILEMNRSGRANPGQILLSILKNPMVIATMLALACKGVQLAIPDMLYTVVRDIAGVTTTISFISLGVSLNLGEVRSNRRPLVIGTVLRMVLVPMIFLPVAVALGFRGTILCALMVLFAAPAAIASYPMAVAMGADGQLAGQLVCCTTVTSVFTIFGFTFLFQTLGML